MICICFQIGEIKVWGTERKRTGLNLKKRGSGRKEITKTFYTVTNH